MFNKGKKALVKPPWLASNFAVTAAANLSVDLNSRLSFGYFLNCPMSMILIKMSFNFMTFALDNLFTLCIHYENY